MKIKPVYGWVGIDDGEIDLNLWAGPIGNHCGAIYGSIYKVAVYGTIYKTRGLARRRYKCVRKVEIRVVEKKK